MGFKGELASYNPLKLLIMDKRNAQFLEKIKLRKDSSLLLENIVQKYIKQEFIESNNTQQPDWIIAIDGGRVLVMDMLLLARC